LGLFLLRILERSSEPEKFGGNVWKAAEWAQQIKDDDGRPLFDLRKAPSRPESEDTKAYTSAWSQK